MKIVAMRGRDTFLVEFNDEYALVNLTRKRVMKSKQADQFFKFGYFTEPEYDDTIIKQIEKLIEG